MLSLGAVTGRTAASYYEKDDYYFRQSGIGEVIAGEERVGKGFIDLEKFKSLILERTEKITNTTRLADDLCFSAPKSLSILVALDDKNRDKLIQAHQEAVKTVVNYIIDSGMVQTRDQEGNPTAVDKSSVVALRFDHFLSRNKDPQLHSHVLLVNSVVRAEDQKVTAAYLREVYLHKKDLGAMYRQELASRLEKLGYQVEWKKDGTFEVKGFSREQLRAFSSRREEIEKKLEELKQQGIEGGKANEIACKDTRQAKEEIANPFALRAVWEQKTREAGIKELPQPQIQEKSPLKEAVREKDLRTIAEEVISKQLRTAGFTMWHRAELEIAKEASRAGITTSIQEIREVARSVFSEVAQKYGGRTDLDMDRAGRERFTIENVIKADAKSELTGLRDNQLPLDKVQAERVLNEFCKKLQAEKGFTLSEAQKRVILETATASTDVAVVGRAGAGKTTAMQALKEVYESQRKVVIGVSFTGAAAKNLEKETGIKSFTIDSLAARGGFGKFEKSMGGPEKFKGGLLIVDEAGMVSADRASVVQEVAEKYQMKIVWVGDPSQVKPVGTGDPFSKLLKEASVKGSLYELSEIYRQKHPDYLKAAYSASAGNFREVFEIFNQKGWVHEISRKADMIEFAKEQYFKAIQEGKSILLLADTNKLVNRLNSEVRYYLQQAGIVGKEEIKVEVKDTAGKSMGEKEFSKGDVVMFLRNDKDLDVKNGERGVVIKVDKETQTLSVKMQDGSIKQIQLEKYNYFTHGYAMTTVKSQGQTVDRVVYLADPKHITENRAYVAITRGKEECHILTKNANEIFEKLEAEQKIDVAGWSYGRDENENLQASENDVKDYRAIEDVKQTILDSASRETWYSLTQEEKEMLVKGKLDSEALQEKSEQAIEKVAEWYPSEEKLESEEVCKETEAKYQEGEITEEQKEQKEQKEEKEKERNFDPAVKLEEERFDPSVRIEEKQQEQKEEEQREEQQEQKEKEKEQKEEEQKNQEEEEQRTQQVQEEEQQQEEQQEEEEEKQREEEIEMEM